MMIKEVFAEIDFLFIGFGKALRRHAFIHNQSAGTWLAIVL